MATAKGAAPKKASEATEPEIGDNTPVVAVVTRNADGTPAVPAGFVLVVPEDPTDEELAAAWNAGGELPPADQPLKYHPRGW